ncbi:nitrite oxidoreductase/nitrate reductase alpha subunit, partial [Candidatus Thiomargarita nelsonii]
HEQPGPVFTEQQREEWGDFVIWDENKNQPVAMNRDQIGKYFPGNPQLEGQFEVPLVSGETVKCRTVFDVTREMLDGSYTH